jgi:flagellar biosynthesis protein FlhA
MLINVVGGLFVGVLQHNLDVATAARTYTLLTIGDGLVAQIPALIVSIAAGMVVTRVGDDEDVSQQFAAQLFSNPKPLYLTAAIVGILGLIPGMPNFIFLLIGGALAAWAWRLDRQRRAEKPLPVAPAPAVAREVQEAGWADVTPLDVLGLEVGYRLIPLVDKAQDGELLRRIRGIRKKFAQDIGFLVSPVHIRDNLELKPNAYKILLKGVDIGEGEAFPGNLLAINPGRVAGQVPGTATRDPAFGLPAVWIDPALREQAQAYGYTVVDPSTVVATHLNHLILSHAAELLGRLETQALLDHLAKEMPKLVEDLVPKALALGVVQKVLRNLLDEGVSLRDMRTVIETLADGAARSQDPEALTAQVRIALGRSIVQDLYPGASDLQVMALDPQLERLLQQAVVGAGDAGGIEPGLADTLVREAMTAAQRQEEAGLPVVLLVSGALRSLLARFLRRTIPQLKVLAHAEVPEHRTIKVTSIIGQRA